VASYDPLESRSSARRELRVFNICSWSIYFNQVKRLRVQLLADVWFTAPTRLIFLQQAGNGLAQSFLPASPDDWANIVHGAITNRAVAISSLHTAPSRQFWQQLGPAI
jgi:hypothetical protein